MPRIQHTSTIFSFLILLAALAVSCLAPTAGPDPVVEPPVFGAITWTVTPADSGSVVLSPAGGTYPKGTLVTLTAVAEAGTYFDHWEGASTATTPQIDWIAEGTQSVTAVFGDKPRLTIDVFPADSGILASTFAPGPLNPGTTVTITQTPAAGFVFDHWEVDGQVVTGTSATTLNVTMAASHGVRAFFTQNEWTILLYLAGGNELAPQALATLRQLETVNLAGSKVTILALVDRKEGVASGWSGTRLYLVKYDTTNTGTPSSVELDSVPLGLTAGVSANLDMGDPETLKGLIRTAKTRYSAAHYGIVFWGHGTGWRSAVSSSRALGIDEDSGASRLYTAELGIGLSAIAEGSSTQKFGFIGMDLCFGAMIETLVEVEPYGRYFVGSEGLVPTNGWRYDLALTALGNLTDKTPLAVADTFFDAYEAGYSNSSLTNLEISLVDLAQINALATAWNTWSSAAASAITTQTLRSSVKVELFTKATGFYTSPGDLGLDMGNAAARVQTLLPAVASASVDAALAAAVVSRYAQAGNAPAAGIAVHFVPLVADGPSAVPDLPHDDAYIRGKTAQYIPKFVTTSTWVPSTTGDGFLDVIWYKAF